MLFSYAGQSWGFPIIGGAVVWWLSHKEYIKDQVPANRLRKLEKDVAVRKLEIAHMEDDIEALRSALTTSQQE